MNNELLNATQEKIESSLWGRTKADYRKVVFAGMKAALHGGPNSIIASLKKSRDPLHDCVVGAVNLAIILRKQSRNSMPLRAMVPGATTLMLHALDFADRAGLLKVDKENLAEATHLLVNTLFHRLEITPAMLHSAATKMHALTQNPVSVERMKFAAGMTKDPRTAEPTPVSGANEKSPDV